MARSDERLTLAAVAEAVASVSAGRNRVVAMGGGGDSALLISVAAQLDDGCTTRAVFVDHDLASSHLLRKASVALCQSLDVELTILPAPVVDGPNLEERCRDARYEALDAALQPDEIGLLGHSLDDDAETVLMRLAHGAGARGLAGIPRQRSRWVRPLLDFSRSDIRTLASESGLTWEEDDANSDGRFERVRVRRDVLPALAAAIPGARRGLGRSASLVRDDDEALTDLISSIPVGERLGMALVPKASLADLPPALAARLIRRACASASPPFVPSHGDVSVVLATAGSGRTGSLSGSRDVVDIGSHLAIGHLPSTDDPVPVPIDEVFVFNDERFRVHQHPHPSRLLPGGRFTVLAATDARDLTMRGWSEGDRIDIGSGRTPVAELLRVAGVASELRPVSPVITSGGTIAAVVGVRTAAWASVSPGEPAVVVEREVQK